MYIFLLVVGFAFTAVGTQYFEKTVGLGLLKPNLSLFSVVKFHNDPCSAADGRNGTCYTSEECRSAGGTSTSPCAQGFGVCCVFEISCGLEASQNVTFLNLNDTSASSACDFRVCPANNDVCRLRLDFESFELAKPVEDTANDVSETAVKNLHSIVGDCLVDTFIVTAGEGPSPPVICGSNTGEHMYTSIRESCATISINVGETTTVTRSVRIKATQIPCTSEPLSDCLQYYTGTVGNVKSFNDGGTGTHLTYQEYTVCVRRERGFCSICWSTDQFKMSLETSDSGLTGNKGMSEHDLDCGRQFLEDSGTGPTYAGFGDYIEIPQGYCVGQNDDTDSVDRYCGEILACQLTAAGMTTSTPSTICSSVYPFQLRVFTDGFEEISKEDGVPPPDATPANRAPQTGFNLFYQQMPC